MRQGIKRAVSFGVGVTVVTLAVWGFSVSNERHSRFTCDDSTWVAQHGDTIWRVAANRCTGNIENAVYHIKELNGGSSIQIGQKVLIPTGNS